MIFLLLVGRTAQVLIEGEQRGKCAMAEVALKSASVPGLLCCGYDWSIAVNVAASEQLHRNTVIGIVCPYPGVHSLPIDP